MTKGHNLKFVFPRMGTTGVSTFLEERWSGKQKQSLYIDSALDHIATNQLILRL